MGETGLFKKGLLMQSTFIVDIRFGPFILLSSILV